MSTKTSKIQGRGWILAALMTTIMLAAMDATIVSTAIPHIVGDLGGFSLFSWVFSIYLLAQTITIPIYGKLADLYGRKPILIFGIILFLIGSATSAFSWNMISLIVFRGIQGLGAGSIMANVNTLAGDLFSIQERAKIQGWLSSVWGMAAITGPALGGAFAEYISWRWIFLINVPIGIIALILLIIFLKENVTQKKHHLDIPGALMMLLTGGVLIYTFMEGGQSFEWLSEIGIGLIFLSLLLILITVQVERRSPEPILPKWVWKNRTLVGANLAVIAMGAMMLGPNMYLPVFSQSVYGLGAIASGFVLSSISIGWPISSSLSGKLYLRIGFRNTGSIGILILIIFTFIFSILPLQTPVWVVVINHILIGAGFGLLSTSTMVGIQSIVPWEKRGVVTSSNMFSRYLGQSIGAAVLASVFNSSMEKHLNDAPEKLTNQLPKVNDVIDTMQSPSTSEAVVSYLQEGFYLSTGKVYLGMTILAIIAFIFLYLQPKKMNIPSKKEK